MPARPRARRPFLRRAGALSVGAVLAAVAGLPAVPVAQAAKGGDSAPTQDLLMVQANIYSGLTVKKFQADVATVLDLAPDFITYNEVPFRNDLVMAPPARSYAIHRSKKNRYTAATAVAWRTDRWTLVDSGTHRISNHRGKPPGRKIELGRRFANWVTVQSPLGRTVSVVSVHVAPVVKGMPDLRRPSVKRLGVLVERLSPAGPVLVGGDFNAHYRSGTYPRDLLTEAGLVPTFDMLKSHFATGDHRGATIDYVFNRHEDQMWAAHHRPVELNSDHDAVVAGFRWTVDAPAETQVVSSDPSADQAGRRATIKTLTGALRATEPGSVVEVVTSDLAQMAVFRALKDALARGVHVRLTTRSAELTPRERRLQRAVERAGDEHSMFRVCVDTCRAAARDAGLPAGLVMISNPKQRWRTRIDSDQEFRSFGQRATRVVVRTGKFGLAEGADLLGSIS